MKHGILFSAWLALAQAAPPQARLGPLDELLPWYDPGGCSGLYTEQCMGSASFCATRDREPCLAMRRAPPRHLDAEAENVGERGLG
ncbi:hypothetical protein G6O67_006444 [Ophiocordyceps sinensis]|uniref:Uncharacterized protein n=1 Tax=Ophiocordyceps sinensis TaxID=72228 RepID=A0A8H4PM72_9HYPO|nr:hypothetical protein G6O67_006444 [Ophiocordyceps sinensis]